MRTGISTPATTTSCRTNPRESSSSHGAGMTPASASARHDHPNDDDNAHSYPDTYAYSQLFNFLEGKLYKFFDR
jgi:hypothetical protein